MSLPKLRKTFFFAAVTFNMDDQFEAACTVKMLSILNICIQCPHQFSFYAMVLRYYRQESTVLAKAFNRQKYG